MGQVRERELATGDRRAGLRYRDGLATTLAGAAIPYGYTLVVWSTGSVVVNERHALPTVWDVVLFAAGAVTAYGLLRASARRGDVHRPAGIAEYGLIRGGVAHGCAIATAIAGAALVSHVAGTVSWVLAPFVATLAYLGGTALNEAREVELREDD